MSTQSSNQKWKISTAILTILFILLVAISAYAVAQNSNLNNDKTNLQNQYNALKTTDDANVQKIASLNSNIASLTSQISTLQAQQTADASQITHLQAELSANYTLLQKLESPNVIVTIEVSTIASAPPFCIFSICIGGNPGSATIDAIAYANLGTIDTMATVTVSFYSTPTVSTTPLCTTAPINLGLVKGQSIYGLRSPMGGSCTWPEPPAGGMGVDALSYSVKVSLS